MNLEKAKQWICLRMTEGISDDPVEAAVLGRLDAVIFTGGIPSFQPGPAHALQASHYKIFRSAKPNLKQSHKKLASEHTRSSNAKGQPSTVLQPA